MEYLAGTEGDMLPQNISPQSAWDTLNMTPNAILVDVRTAEELECDGRPDISSASATMTHIPWRTLPGMQLNSNFGETLEEIAQDKNASLFFLCKSAIRSVEAGAYSLSQGYTNCYNITQGTGDISQHGSWQGTNLPWRTDS